MTSDEGRQMANVRWAGDRERLLPGERPETSYSDDAHHWVRVYTELIAFNREMMQAVRRRMASARPSERGPEGPDLVLLRAHVRRLRFWQRRLDAMGPAGADGGGVPLTVLATPIDWIPPESSPDRDPLTRK